MILLPLLGLGISQHPLVALLPDHLEKPWNQKNPFISERVTKSHGSVNRRSEGRSHGPVFIF
jgi:hypothetical protein